MPQGSPGKLKYFSPPPPTGKMSGSVHANVIILVWSNISYCRIITLELGTSSITLLALSLK